MKRGQQLVKMHGEPHEDIALSDGMVSKKTFLDAMSLRGAHRRVLFFYLAQSLYDT